MRKDILLDLLTAVGCAAAANSPLVRGVVSLLVGSFARRDGRAYAWLARVIRIGLFVFLLFRARSVLRRFGYGGEWWRLMWDSISAGFFSSTTMATRE
jgi:hypothetical protein